MKKIMIWIGYFFLSLLALILLYLATDFVLSRIPAGGKKESKIVDRSIEVYLLSNGVHTDIVLPVRYKDVDWSKIFPFENTIGRDSMQNWVAVGWGDKGFYLNTPEWKDLSAKTALIAGLGIGETALHVTYYKQLSEGEYCRAARVSDSQYRLLVSYILSSIERDSSGNPILINTTAQYNKDDAFYEAEGAYSLFFSCNTWTNKGLKQAEMPAGVWTLFSYGILRHYKTVY